MTDFTDDMDQLAAELRAALQKGGAMGASGAEVAYQGAGGEDQR